MTHKAIKAKSARYPKLVEWTLSAAPPSSAPCCHGDDEAKVYAELCRIVEEWIELLETDGTPLPEATSDRRDYSGKFVLRVEPTMHRRLVLKALAEGESLNSYCAKTLAKPPSPSCLRPARCTRWSAAPRPRGSWVSRWTERL